MVGPIVDAVDWASPPEGLDQIAADLRAMRRAAGDPSYAEIARRISVARAARGVPDHERRIPRTTVFNCFKDGRRRIDTDVVVEIARSLGLPSDACDRWSMRLRLARSAADGAAVAAVRDHMPLSVPSFAGRTAEVAVVTDVLSRAHGNLWISGMAGMGKTQMALRALEVDENRHAVFLDLRGFHAELPPVDPAAAQRSILRYFDLVEDGSPDQRAQRIRDALQQSQRVLLLDDASGLAQVTSIIGHGSGGHVIVTSRARLEGDRAPAAGPDAWERLALHGVGAQETAEIVRAIVTATASTVAIGSEEIDGAAAHMAEITGGLPLAVSLIGARLGTHPEWSLGEHLDLLRARLERGHVEESVLEQLDLSYRDLPARAARLLRAFSDLPLAEIDAEVAAELLETTTDEADVLLTQLSRYSLVTPRGADRFALHSMMRAFGRARAEETDPPRSRSAAFERAGRFLAERVWGTYEVIAASMDDRVRRTAFSYPALGWDAERAAAWLRAWLPSLLALAHAAPERGHPELLFRLSEGLSWWMNLAGYRADALRLHEAAADVAAEAGDTDAITMASLDAGQLLVLEDEPARAQEHFERAMRLIGDAGELFDPSLIGLIHNMSAVIDMRYGRMDAARKGFSRAVALHEERNETFALMSALINLGVVLQTIGAFDEAAQVIERALHIAEDHDNALFRANLLVNRGELRVEQGDLHAAREDAATAVELAEGIGHAYLMIAGESVLAEAHRREGSLEIAMDHAQRALAQARALKMGMVISEALLIIAAIHADHEHPEPAGQALDEVECLLTDGADQVMRGKMWSIRARITDDPGERTGSLARALEQFSEAGSFHAAALVDTAGARAT